MITEPNDKRLVAAVQDHATPVVDSLERLMHLLTGLTQQFTAGLADPKLDQSRGTDVNRAAQQMAGALVSVEATQPWLPAWPTISLWALQAVARACCT